MIRSLFKSLSLREMALLVTFIWVMLLIWITTLADLLGEVNRQWQTVRTELRLEATVIERGPGVEQALEEQLAVLNPALTLSSDELLAKVDTIARDLGVQFSLSTLNPEEIQDFDIYKLRIQMRGASMEDLIDFNDAILQESPYMKIESIKLDANQADPARLNASFVINSFEQPALSQ